MNQEQIMKTAFIVSIVSTIMATIFKIMHVSGISIFFTITLLAAVIWTILALVEIYSSNRLHISEKIMWTVGFLVFNVLAGILYFLSGRQRVIERKRHFDIQH